MLSDFQFSKGGRSSVAVPAGGSRTCPLRAQHFPLEAAQILPTRPGSIGSGPRKGQPPWNTAERLRVHKPSASAGYGKAPHCSDVLPLRCRSTRYLHHPHAPVSDVLFSELETRACTAGRQPGRELASPGCPKDQGSLNKATLWTRVVEGRWFPL